MKKQLLFLLLLITTAASAQIVNVPDVAFKEALLSNYTDAKDLNGNIISLDANNDGEIQLSEALNVGEITIDLFSFFVFSLEGIGSFSNLTKLSITEADQLLDLDLTALTQLTQLSISDSNEFDSINLNGLSNLENINFNGLTGGGDSMLVLNVSGVNNLTHVNFTDVVFDMDFSQLPSLESLILNNTSVYFDLSANNNLSYVSITNPQYVDYFLLGNKPLLTYLNLNFNGGIGIVNDIDLSGCTALDDLFLRFDEAVAIIPIPFRTLNLKNGISNYDSFTVMLNNGNLQPIYVCIDEGNETLFSETVLNDPNVLISSYCNFTPGGDYNTITGNFTFDADNDGCDINDNLINHTRVDITTENDEEFAVFSNNIGEYNFYWGAGTFTLSPSIENNDWFTITPSSATVTFEDDNNNIETQSFCVTPNGEHPDVEVVIVPTEPAQPGFNASYKITYRNKGNQTLSGNVLLTYDETVLDYVSSTSGVGAATNTFGWSYSDLQPFETRNINLTLNVNAPTDTPAVNIDDLLMFTANITSATGDENPDDNTFTLAQTVVGSFDPNDITCLEGEAVHVSKIGDYLHYNINFENTGTAPATFIVVKNEINEEQFDVSTLQLIDASHNVETRITGNKVEFYFGNINLAANGGKGNVLYKIKTLNTLQEDDIVMQEANIYFDYNFPIETNEANTTFAVLSNDVLTKDDSVKLYPNPTTDNVTIAANSAITSVQLYDVQGRLLHSRVGNETSIRLDVSAQPSGLYFVKITTDNGSKVEKLVKE
ncbi:T9SS C-terminal target domain-containing protein [Flavobacterium arcticum]|uniref:T9SS C-terminal target domain-containing protein n=1 Tax=Flavobacterium arcticum TaxID=1784713 RepID=A0A345H9H8_9FLAO|nr:T9SS type A sorting domain-containing protein [Flavobacterium arcticum]AXG73238.1 T9SS C-terminal target domain-containing protein [Flavobacterium arcticum]KAF2513032.1 T9SS type A sorting domain-containing protein [Flavobacterium arcticum]